MKWMRSSRIHKNILLVTDIIGLLQKIEMIFL
jgi:hypothetical protein